MECVDRIVGEMKEEMTNEELSDLIKNVHTTSTFSSSERASLGVYSLILFAKEWKAVPAIFEKFGSVIRSVGFLDSLILWFFDSLILWFFDKY